MGGAFLGGIGSALASGSSFVWFVAAGALLGGVGGLVAASRLRLVVGDTGVQVCNGLGASWVAWSEISEVGLKFLGWPSRIGRRPWLLVNNLGANPPVLGIRTRAGVERSVWGSAYLAPRDRDVLVQLLRQAADRHGFRITVDSADLRTYFEFAGRTRLDH
jgi:hypothetical protein